MLIVCIVLGLFFPLYLPKTIWLYLVFAYIFIASVVPVWALEQPRNFLNSFLLIAMVITAFFGVIFTAPAISIPMFTGFQIGENFLFPGLFVTIACGSISGFHSLVATGAASKQLSNERYMLRVSYGAMLAETLVAVLALIAVGCLTIDGKLPVETPPVIFATAVSGFLYQLGLPYGVSFTLVSLAVSAFVLTTLDTVARLGRLSFQEFFAEAGEEKPSFKTAVIKVLRCKPAASLFTLFPAYILAIMGYQNIWVLFGAANQLLAALTLIACALFLKRTGKKCFMLFIPAFVMMAVTFTSLIFTIKSRAVKWPLGSFKIAVDGLQIFIALSLLILGIMVAASCILELLKKDKTNIVPAGG
jgi:carbon starvation protein